MRWVDRIEGCKSCPYVYGDKNSKSPTVFDWACAHPMTAHLMPVSLAANKPPADCPLRRCDTVVKLKKKGARDES